MDFVEPGIVVAILVGLLVLFLIVERAIFVTPELATEQDTGTIGCLDRVLSNTGPTSLILFGAIFAEIAIPAMFLALLFCRSPQARSNARWILVTAMLRASFVWLPKVL